MRDSKIVSPKCSTIPLDDDLLMFKDEVTKELTMRILAFWKSLMDDENGGYYGYLSYDLQLDRKAEKGCILNSRIT